MKIIKECGIEDFEAWSSAVDTKDKIIEAGMSEEFDSYIESSYPDGINETDLNDLLWFESDSILQELGISEDEEDEDEEETEEEEENE